MTHGQLSVVARYVHKLADARALEELTDGQLLERFINRKEEAAFASLVRRHGPMVLGVCRRVLQNWHAAEDAFQAAFLVLFRRARSLDRRGSIANWLYTVAYHVALKARAGAAHRRQRETEGGHMAEAESQPHEIWRDLQRVLDEELNALPEKYRAPVVLCYVEGKTNVEAARLLGWPVGTVKGRLARARELLQTRLTHRGITLSGGLLSVVLAEHASAAVPGLLVESTVKTVLVAAGKATAGLSAAPAAALAEGVLKTMFATKLKIATALLLAVGVFGTGLGTVTRQVLAQRQRPVPVKTTPRAGSQVTEGTKPDLVQVRAKTDSRSATQSQQPKVEETKKMLVTGRVLNPDGKPVAGASVAVLAGVSRLQRYGGWSRMDEVLGQDTADDQGRFRLVVARTVPSPYWGANVIAASPGYGFAWQPFDPNADQPNVLVQLLPEQLIRGRLVDLQGLPARGVQLHVVSVGRKDQDKYWLPQFYSPFQGAVRPLRDNGIDMWSSDATARLPHWPKPMRTDSEGRFTLSGIGQNLAVRLAVRDDAFAPVNLDIDTSDKDRAWNANHALQPGCILEGRVTYADTGKPAVHARLIATLGGGGSTDEKGSFRLNTYVPDSVRPYIIAYSPEREPYQVVKKYFERPKGATRLEINLALPRGILVRGKVVEEGSGKPVMGAEVRYGPQRFDAVDPNDTITGRSAVVTGSDGAFQVVCLPGPGHVLVNGPDPDYIFREFGYHGLAMFDLKPDEKPNEVTIPLRRGITLRGRLVDANGNPVAEAEMFSRVIARHGKKSQTKVSDGHFELHGCDAKETYALVFVDVKNRMAGTVNLSGKQMGDDIPTVHLAPCGSVKLLYLDRDGKPLANFRTHVRLVLPVGPSEGEKGVLPADDSDISYNYTDLAHPFHNTSPRSDKEGYLSFPALVPDVTYQIMLYDLKQEFTVKSGQHLELPAITINDPN